MPEVRNVATFAHPLFAVRQNKTVKILALGDQEGKSPVYLMVDDFGRSTWQSVNEFQIIDFTALPVPVETLRNITQQTQSR